MKCCDITAGKLNKQVKFQRPTETRREGGGSLTSWGDLFSAWAKVTPKTGTERTHAGKLEAKNYSVVIMRYTSDLDEADRMVLNGDKYQIRSIINIEEMNQWLELKVEKGVVT